MSAVFLAGVDLLELLMLRARVLLLTGAKGQHLTIVLLAGLAHGLRPKLSYYSC